MRVMNATGFDLTRAPREGGLTPGAKHLIAPTDDLRDHLTTLWTRSTVALNELKRRSRVLVAHVTVFVHVITFITVDTLAQATIVIFIVRPNAHEPLTRRIWTLTREPSRGFGRQNFMLMLQVVKFVIHVVELSNLLFDHVRTRRRAM